ncbi:hypothetical protein [Ectopseudomonas toyotomiensis]|uniref:Uncharacterized protein n=1 Tax=Ectopseudomonas toyotomiensis TaxID=554344 RepID=A0AA42LF11_9GAMM|nr:hypothetical protein [Pseudomonas toyotomiensis]MBG0843054.1 hypothetical protein [Pseudomonas toyotomiensis]MDH0703141.1 hypothetical protein [Pseudomonas toyotomiensis]
MNVLFSKKVLAFLLLILSSLGFSCSLLLVRVVGNKADLAYLIDFQSILVILSFILQFGFRACLRYEYFCNHKLLVARAESLLIFFLAAMSCCSLVLSFFSSNYFFATSALLAVLTLRQGLAVAAQNLREQAKYAVCVFVLCCSGVVLVFLPFDAWLKDLIFEILSAGVLVLMTCLGRFKVHDLIKKSWIFYYFFLRSQGFQLGSGLGYFFGFILAQTVVSNYASSSVIESYADVQLIAGVVSLFAGKFVMLIEGRFYEKGANNFFIFALLLFLCGGVSLLISFGLWLYHEVDFWLLYFMCSILLSRFLIGFLVQYVERRNSVFYLFLVMVLMLQLVLYFFEGSIFMQYTVSVLVVVAGLYFMSKGYGYER